jgi:hypothetical protein
MGKYPNPLKTTEKASARRRGVVVLAASVTVASLSALGGCGSEKDNDRKSAGTPSASPTPDPSLKKKDGDTTGKPGVRYKLDPQNPGDPSKLICSAPLGLEVELNPAAPGGSQVLLTGKIDPRCFENRILVIRLKVEKGFRVTAAMSCQKVTTGDFNYECTAVPTPFIQDDSIAVPVSMVPGSQPNFKAEAEMVLQEAPK